MTVNPNRRVQAEISCLVCRQQVKMMLPHSANCLHCGAVYTLAGKPEVAFSDGKYYVIQNAMITGKNHQTGEAMAVEQKITWDL